MARTFYQDFTKDDGRKVTVEYSYRGDSPTTYSPHSGAVGGDGCEVEIVEVFPNTPEFDDLCRQHLRLEDHPGLVLSNEQRDLLRELEADMERAREAVALTDAEDERICSWIAEHHVDEDYDDEPF